MIQERSLSKAQLISVLDHAPMAVLVGSSDNHTLLYANCRAKDTFLADIGDDELYDLLNATEVQAREYRHPVSGLLYQFNGQIIDWDGEPVHIIYITDIKEKKCEEECTNAQSDACADVSEQQRLEEELNSVNEKTRDIINAIPGGVAIYRISDIFETVYFSDGVPALTGYSVEEYRDLVKQDAAEMIYQEDIGLVAAKAREVIESRGIAMLEFRKQHRDGHVVWVRVQAKWMGEDEGYPLLHCVFHNISDLKETQFEMQQLINSIPGGIASCRLEGECLIPLFYSDGVPALTGHSRNEYDALAAADLLAVVYELDKERVKAAVKNALYSGEVLDISYRTYHKNGGLIWLHVKGQRMGPLAESAKFYAVFMGMSDEARLFQEMANDTADGIYVIGKENKELFYVNESEKLFVKGRPCLGMKCYTALHGKSEPCEFCHLRSQEPDLEDGEAEVEDSGHVYTIRFKEVDWNGIPAYVKYIRDTTEEAKTRRERDRLEQYFQNMLKNLPGGVAVVRYEKDGGMIPEYISEGLAATTGMTLEETWKLYQEDALKGVHPDDREHTIQQLADYIASGKKRCEIEYRLLNGTGDYVWVKNTLSLIQSEGGEQKLYSVYSDMTLEREERAHVWQQYNDLILQHYQRHDPNALVLGHCNITQNFIIEIMDHTGLALRETFGSVREEFFIGLSTLIDENERQAFRDIYLREPSLAAFERGETEQTKEFYVHLPNEDSGRYVQFEMHMVSTPDSGDVTGILTVTDITEQVVSDRILHQLSVTGYDFAADLDLTRDTYKILSLDQNAHFVPPKQGKHSKWMEYMMEHRVVPKDREKYWNGLNMGRMAERLEQGGAYTFAFSLIDDDGDVRTKNMTVSPIDLRLGRVCLSRTDITDSIREQQRLLRVIAYTCELAGFIDVFTCSFTMYTRQMVLENLPPHTAGDYNTSLDNLAGYYETAADREAVKQQFRLENLLRQLEEKPDGYDFVLPYQSPEGNLRYKQVNVLWGDQNHKTVCLVRADVTDMLAAERDAKAELEKALELSREASRAKSDFLSAMSHDIRTPMNAIMGMTTLANANAGDPMRVQSCLQKISMSSKHLLSLINDVLDMSRIEQAKIELNRERLYMPELVVQATEIIAPQAEAAGLKYDVQTGEIHHPYFYGDALRTNQILINILGNSVKFTPAGGNVRFLLEEIPETKGDGWVRYRFTVSDTGIGIPEETQAHLFEPFARSSAVSRVEGSGLGLSIVKGLVDLMGGEISVQSKVNHGSTFTVEMENEIAPVPEETETKAFEEPVGEPLAGKRFLVAEDNEINAEIMCEILRMYGAESELKVNGAQAVEEFFASEPETYDAILMDIQMPDMNGYEAARAIRSGERADAETIPIIAMTANAFEKDIRAAMEAGMNAHIAKPVDIGVLLETLGNTLDGRTGRKR